MAGGWLVEKVDSALLDDLVGLHVAKKLLSVYHTGTGRFAYAPPDAAETVDIDGVAVPLAELVEDMTQLIDGEEGAAQLRAQSLFFMDSANVKLIEEWVEKEIMPNELLLILEAVLMPMLVTSGTHG